jgi:hypothetical protein
VGDESDNSCALDVDAAAPVADVAACADLEATWPTQVFAIEVQAGDCLYMRADNAGSDGADLFGALVDPVGNNVLLDEEVDCTVVNPSGYLCPEGALTMEAAGEAYVFAGAFADAGCPVAGETPYQLVVTLNGVDVDLAAGPICRGDLLQIVP